MYDPEFPLVGAEAVRFDDTGRPILIATHCAQCGQRSLPPSVICSGCGSTEVSDEAQPAEGELYTFTTVHVAGKRWGGPVTYGYVDLPTGLRVFSHLEGAGWHAGDRAEFVIARRGAAGNEVNVFAFRRQEGRQ